MAVWLSTLDADRLCRDDITRLLFESDHASQPTEAPADGIFVFGGANPERVARAVGLFHEGRAPFIVFSGGTRWGQLAQPEALLMRERALDLGVPGSSILVETESNHSKENVIASLLVLDRAVGLHHIHRLLVVSAPYHMRRCLLTLHTYMPQWITYEWCPDDRQRPRVDNWWQKPEDEQLILREARSLIRYVQEGQLLDENVSSPTCGSHIKRMRGERAPTVKITRDTGRTSTPELA